MSEKNDLEVVDFLSRPENVKTAFQVYGAFPEVLRNLRVKFWRSTEEFLKKALSDEFVKWTYDFNDKRSDVILINPRENGSRSHCCIAVGDGTGQTLYYGVMLPAGLPPEPIPQVITLDELLLARGFKRREAGWLRWKYFGDVSLKDSEVLAKLSEGDVVIQQSLAGSVVELLRDSGEKVLDANRAMAR